MPTPLEVLIVNDSEDDAGVLSLELKRGGFEVNYLRVDTEKDMINALKSATWDLVISDYTMVNFSGPDALKVLKWQGFDLPFILVSGKVGEETIVEAMKAGANNYILKDNLARLVPAVWQELQEFKSKWERCRIEKALEDSEEKYRSIQAEEELSRAIFEQTQQAIIVCDENGGIIRASEVAKTLCGSTPLLKSFDLTFPLCFATGDRAGGQFSIRNVLEGEVFHEVEVTFRQKGRTLHLLLNAGPLTSKKTGVMGCVVTLTDISQRKQVEESLRRSQENLRRLSKTANEGILILDAENNTIYANPKLSEMLGYSPKEMVGMSYFQFLPKEGRINAEINLKRLRQGMSRQHDIKFLRKDGGHLWAILSSSPILDDERHYEGMLGMVTDITARIRAEDAGRVLLEELRLANEEMRSQTERLEIHKEELLRLTQGLDTAKQKLIEICISLSSENDLSRLLKKIINELRCLTNADGGSIYLVENGKLRFEVAQNNTLMLLKGEDFQFFKQYELAINKSSIAGYVALTSNVVNIPDAYELSADFPCQFNPEFDLRNNYHTQSLLAVPLKDHTGKVIGVLELVNAMDEKGEPVSFRDDHENLVLSLASLAAVAINKARLIQTIQKSAFDSNYSKPDRRGEGTESGSC